MTDSTSLSSAEADVQNWRYALALAWLVGAGKTNRNLGRHVNAAIAYANDAVELVEVVKVETPHD